MTRVFRRVSALVVRTVFQSKEAKPRPNPPRMVPLATIQTTSGSPDQLQQRPEAAGQSRPECERYRDGGGKTQVQLFQPRQAEIDWRRGRKDGEEIVEERTQQAGERDLVDHRKTAERRRDSCLFWEDRRTGDDGPEHQRQQPRVAVVQPQEQHAQSHYQERDLVGPDDS